MRNDRIYTIDDIYALPEGQRAELIDGKFYEMVHPGTVHQRLLVSLSCSIGNYIESKKVNCEVFIAPFAVFIDKDIYNYVEPDIAVICDPSKLDERGCNGAPDWVIEIVMPENRTMDYLIKLRKYYYAGVREYWIVDPDKERVTVYRFREKEQVEEYGFDEEIPVGIYDEDLTIRIRKTI